MDSHSVKSSSSVKKDDLHLNLYPWAHSEKKVQHNLKNGIKVHCGNKVRSYINGQVVWVTLDSGISDTVLYQSLASKLGYLKGDEKRVMAKVTSVLGTKKIEVVKVKRLVLTLESGQQVCDQGLILPNEMAHFHDESSIVLGFHMLQRGGMVQIFHQEGSTLFICSPKRVKEPSRCRKLKGVGTFTVLPRGIGATIKTVVVSTGMYSLYFSVRMRNKLRHKLRTGNVQHSVTLILGGKHILKGIPVKALPYTNVDFILGRRLLHQYEAIMSYKDNKLLIPCGTVMRVISLTRRQV